MAISRMDTQRQFDLCLRTMSLALNRSERFCEGVFASAESQLHALIEKRFSNNQSLEQTGLRYAYTKLANDLYKTDARLFGLLISESDESVEVTQYSTLSGQTITLTVKSILDELLKYLDQTKVIELCKQHGKYIIYYRHCVDHRK